MKIFKLLFYNLLIFFLFLILIETIFGYCFDKNSLGPYMREHRLKKVNYSLKYKDQNYNYIYKRNYYGFRGDDVELNNIKAILVGGSTTDERYKPYDLTIVGQLNKKFAEKKIKFKIVNAGIEGQSTIGHIHNFENWFPRLKEFKPDFIIFYIGINDSLINPQENKSTNGHVLNPSRFERFKDNIKSRSVFYDLLRKIKHKYYNRKEKLIYDFDHALNNPKKKKTSFMDFDEALQKHDVKKLLIENSKLIENYLSNIDKLVNYSEKLNAKPIFINQLTEEGSSFKNLFIMNYSLINHCVKKNYNCIDLARKLKGKNEFWWDGIHTTPEGSINISNIIFPELLNLIRKD